MDKKEKIMEKRTHPRGIYLLPNLFTTAALFSGFYAVVAAMKGSFDIAAIAIFIAMVADTLDGRVARLTNTQTAFGAEYDSLSDMLAFGIAPALIVYSWSLSHLGKLGWMAAFLYTAGTGLRLARFNTQSHDMDKRYFQGLPCPAAAGMIVSGVWLGYGCGVEGILIAIPMSVLTIMAAAFMVSTIRYHSFKQIDLKDKVSFFILLVPVLVIATIAVDPPKMLFAIFFCYAISGPLLTLLQLRKMRKQSLRAKTRDSRSINKS
ncbi:MAG: pssA [Gammaproteobacteria bacterium]|jgi:CDP-diacylglycerol--serine O-phosphatidyltransferase|nr:pssA [Gammaproteobacteria bacterium]